MKKQLKTYFGLFILFFSVLACSSGGDSNATGGSISITGKIVNENNTPLAGVEVKSGNSIATTSAAAATTMLQTFADVKGVEGFYLASAAAGNALFTTQLPAFTCIEQGALFAAAPAAIAVGSLKAGDTACDITAQCVITDNGGTGGAAIGATVGDFNVQPSASTLDLLGWFSFYGLGLSCFPLSIGDLPATCIMR